MLIEELRGTRKVVCDDAVQRLRHWPRWNAGALPSQVCMLFIERFEVWIDNSSSVQSGGGRGEKPAGSR